ncbi:hypothetical protein GLYMA_16G206700v4 [Glycine max]|uniref:Uncharacterized protein n=1 Tax=Glycine max TaxID=3847 RepID=A0A0R0G1W6_SOYBN|nr:hypothetical protein JHK86_045928 [Glycine max]KAG4941826.1 hypothetical protein JHK87_045697 [Glycine soja]KAH1152185.1 hypothetical protein GYH30_045611 [Glycine max]KRH09257.1 hypothetical protein GLYMA_16G206700v4 [Glycine max]
MNQICTRTSGCLNWFQTCPSFSLYSQPQERNHGFCRTYIFPSSTNFQCYHFPVILSNLNHSNRQCNIEDNK